MQTALHNSYMRNFLLSFAFSRFAALGSQMSAPGRNAITIRDAVIEDLDQITEIGISSFPLDPQWNYRYPYREQHPKVHYDCCRQRWEEWLAASRTPDCMILVVEGPSNENGLVKKVLAFSIWKMPSHLSDKGDKYQMKPPTYSHRKDANYAHMKAYRESSIEAEHRLFEPKYGNRRMDLAQLVTHPDYYRQGLARKLVERGQQIATEGNYAIGVFASPMGQALYEKCGFKVLDIVVARAEGESEALEFPALAWEPVQFRNG